MFFKFSITIIIWIYINIILIDFWTVTLTWLHDPIKYEPNHHSGSGSYPINEYYNGKEIFVHRDRNWFWIPIVFDVITNTTHDVVTIVIFYYILSNNKYLDNLSEYTHAQTGFECSLIWEIVTAKIHRPYSIRILKKLTGLTII